MGAVHTYNPRKVTCALGAHIVSGFADDSMITVEFGGDGTSYVSGADGELVRSIDPTDFYIMKLQLQQTSRTNIFLQNMYDRDSEDGSGTFSVNVNDILGREKFTGGMAWVTKPASWVRGKTQNNREWELVVANGQHR